MLLDICSSSDICKNNIFLCAFIGISPILQARFAHLCTVMSRMHHRREGYPFGTLVDFAPDSMGRKLLLYCQNKFFRTHLFGFLTIKFRKIRI